MTYLAVVNEAIAIGHLLGDIVAITFHPFLAILEVDSKFVCEMGRLLLLLLLLTFVAVTDSHKARGQQYNRPQR